MPVASEPFPPDPAALRRAYGRGRLLESDLASDPYQQFQRWLADAVAADLPEPNAMVLATAGADGAPGARMVLLKGLDERGLAFYTNLRSRKGREVAENPRATLVLAWLSLQRQVVVDGRVEPVGGREADEYFASRPHGARLAALASPQSEPIGSREVLERRHAELAGRHPEGSPVPRPGWWGGLRVVPASVELWQGREDRLHDRLRYRCAGSGEWVIERLAP